LIPESLTRIESFILGPLGNNSYLLFDTGSKEAVVIDPSFNPAPIRSRLDNLGLYLCYILLTHAHFDHIAGVAELLSSTSPHPIVAIHRLEMPLWNKKGEADHFGFILPVLPVPDIFLEGGNIIEFGNTRIQAVFTPGHTPGHLVFHIPEIQVVFTGDLIFFRGVGRTDLPDGDSSLLYSSIDEKILTLPPETRLLSGHGPATTVADEMKMNPFI
jgi:hydroxyacylglutathione hydrolase